MSEYIITTDSTVDLPKDYLKEKQVPIMHLTYTIDGETYPDMEGLDSAEFFARIRSGSMPSTSQVNPEEARRVMEPILREGKDILHLGFSSGLSGSCNSAMIAAEELRAEYPERTILVIDTLSASMGEGLLLYKALELQEAGKSIEEVQIWVEKHKMSVCHFVTVDDLNHLQRGGRISKATAVLGTMINIKPIIHVDEEGKLTMVNKERGRKKSLNTIVDMLASQSLENDIVMVAYGDCREDAEYTAKLIREKMGVEHVMLNTIGTVIGSHTGPSVVVIFGFGKKR